jgi:uncharacterized protein
MNSGQTRLHRPPRIPLAVIRRFARKLANKFHPDRIILFGSYAYGQPNVDSDVDLLVIMPARNQLDRAFQIRLALRAPFPMDLIVRTPNNVKWRLQEGDSFLSEILSKGKVLYEKDDFGMGAQSRSGPRLRTARKSKQGSST